MHNNSITSMTPHKADAREDPDSIMGLVTYAFSHSIRAPCWSRRTTLAELTSSLPSCSKALTIASATVWPSCGLSTTATHVGPAPLMVHPKAPATAPLREIGIALCTSWTWWHRVDGIASVSLTKVCMSCMVSNLIMSRGALSYHTLFTASSHKACHTTLHLQQSMPCLQHQLVVKTTLICIRNALETLQSNAHFGCHTARLQTQMSVVLQAADCKTATMYAQRKEEHGHTCSLCCCFDSCKARYERASDRLNDDIWVQGLAH